MATVPLKVRVAVLAAPVESARGIANEVNDAGGVAEFQKLLSVFSGAAPMKLSLGVSSAPMLTFQAVAARADGLARPKANTAKAAAPQRGMVFIVLIDRDGFRNPPSGAGVSAFPEETSNQGIPISNYNLPDWEETPEGFNRLLERLFQSTPPNALFIDETPWFSAAVGFLLRRGIRVPEQVPLVSADCDTMLDSCHPRFGHMRWDRDLIIRRVVRWVDAVRNGKPDRKIIKLPAESVPGGGIGPV